MQLVISPELAETKGKFYTRGEVNAAVAIICRMSSSRLPGKALMKIHDKPVVQYIVESIKAHLPFIKYALVTSTHTTDDAIADFGSRHGISVIRGELANVAARFAHAITEFNCDVIFRINGDSPLAPVGLFNLALDAMYHSDWDIVTNIQPRTFPPGMSIELIRSETFLQIQPKLIDLSEREHVTSHFYSYSKQFRILNLRLPCDYSHYHLAVDTLRDLQILEKIIQLMKRPHWTYPVMELLSLYRRANEIC